MKRIITIALTSLLALGACDKGSSPKGSEEKCKAARGEAATKWEEAEAAWGRIHASWTEKELTSKVEKALKEKIGAGEEGPAKVAKEMVTFKDYLSFKIENSSKAKSLAKRAASALKEKPEKALKVAGRAQRASRDKSVTQHNQAAWFTNPAVAEIDEAQDKVVGLATEALNLTEKAEEACKK
ncbi:MAG: hypothetical protein RBU30_05320 [Polyangia bacterium]|jgi:hypothetical protein|nr:hypothetical protein [Polyangia bacterium]